MEMEEAQQALTLRDLRESIRILPEGVVLQVQIGKEVPDGEQREGV